MNVRLIQTCAGLWVVGLLGMWALRWGLDVGRGELPFEVCARLWLVGGLGYVVLAAIQVSSERETQPAVQRSEQRAR